MAPTRRKNVTSKLTGLQPGKHLDRNKIRSTFSPWGWVGNVAMDEKDITLEHRLTTCNLSGGQRVCANKYSSCKVKAESSRAATGELEDDIIVISDSESYSCSRTQCKSNPNCLNHLGQQAWESEEGTARRDFMKAMKQGIDPSKECREGNLPVGLKNLGATCYANASLQVWYRDLAFRTGLFSCRPPENITEDKFADSPIFQLQVTFATLQEGNKNVFNPIKLVESLQLRTAEQQDAQEFSKLFISHLDAEFKKQSSPVIRSLISKQFQGTQVYGTICHACKNKSEKPCDFLELEINFDRNTDLEDRLEALLLQEQLTGDNRYFCSRCELLQDATRYTELRHLPPVLHISLLRFVYDVNSMERKKSKHSISFPQVLDMRKFVGSKWERERAQRECSDDYVYELRGVLLHKGPSAYHGHYEAQVHDIENNSWFQFNDEIVTKINGPGDKATGKKPGEANAHNDEDSEEYNTALLQQNLSGRKRRRVEDSDDEDVVEIVKTPPAQEVPSSAITSKEAYMLIYTKKRTQQDANSSKGSIVAPPLIPEKVMNVIKESNASHTEACRVYAERVNTIANQFHALRRKVRNIYMSWTATGNSESAIVSRQALTSWLSEYCIEAGIFIKGGTSGAVNKAQSICISNSAIVCEHGALDPTKSKDMKKISLHSVDEILTETNCVFYPPLKPSDICVQCVSSTFREKLYEIEHPKAVRKLDELSVCQGEPQYWISKKWIKDWRLNKPRMHEFSKPDPAPNSSEYFSHVTCEHGGLSTNTTNRQKISCEAANLLADLFPTWKPISTKCDPCTLCDDEINISKERKKLSRRQVEEEKALLKFILQPSLNSWTNNLKATDMDILISSDFVKQWNRWITNPSNHSRPDGVDNTPFLCEHNQLCFDPSCSVDNSAFILIQQDQWDTLQTLYPAGPLISLNRRVSTAKGEQDSNVSVCSECRIKRKLDWQETNVIIRLVDSGKKCYSGEVSEIKPGARTRDGARQSKRLRQSKRCNEQWTLSITKSTTVMGLKIMISEEFSIPIILQRILCRGNVLDENSATASSLGIYVDDVLEVYEIQDVDGFSDTNGERPSKRWMEGAGFGGTLLGNHESSWSSSPEPPSSSLPLSHDKSCPTCTFSNTLDAVTCEMCETEFP